MSSHSFAGAALAVLGIAPVAVPATAAPSVPYSLSEGSQFQVGCFGGCACPVLIQSPMTGSYSLTTTGVQGDYHLYDVSDAHWLASTDGGQVPITGQGEYRVGGAGGTQQQMTLDLVVGGQAQHYDSGLVPGGDGFPVIDLSLAAHGFFCFDSVLVVRSAPQAGTGAPLPGRFRLSVLAVPNPFRDRTSVSFDLPLAGPVELHIHDVAGRLVRTLSGGRYYSAGRQAVAWDGRDNAGRQAPTGIYFAWLEAPDVDTTLRLERLR